MPVHNTVEYVADAVDSVLAQTLPDLELICIDDGSSDGSAEILEQRAAEDQRVRLHTLEQNRGPGAARNLALGLAEGRFVAFLDSDDMMAPSMLERLVTAAERHRAPLVFCSIEKFSPSATEQFAPPAAESVIPVAFDERAFHWSELGAELFALRYVCANKLVEREFVQRCDLRFSEGIFYEDVEFHFGALLQAPRVHFVRERLYLNRRQREGATTDVLGGRAADMIKAFDRLESFLAGAEEFEPLRQPFVAFRFEKLLSVVHRNDVDHIGPFYERLRTLATSEDVDANPYIDGRLRAKVEELKHESLVEYLTRQLYEERRRNAAVTRRLRQARAAGKGPNPGATGTLRRYRETVQELAERGMLVEGATDAIRLRLGRFADTSGGTDRSNRRSRGGSPSKKKSTRKPAKYVRNSPANNSDGIEFLRNRELARLDAEVVQRIGRRVSDGLPVRIGFVVSSSARWNGDSLLEAIAADPSLTSVGVVALGPNERGGDLACRRADYLEQRRFFEKRQFDALVDLYDVAIGESLPIEDVEVDVVFYEMPWGMNDFPRRMAGRVLNVYMHYGFMMMANHEMHYYMASFHAYLWRYFTQTESHRRPHIEHDPTAADRAVVTGYPKLDVYTSPDAQVVDPWPELIGGNAVEDADKRVIYAPHHSLGRDGLGMSTFGWSHATAVELAEQTPSSVWVYKPHPKLRYSVVSSEVMTESEYATYLRGWQGSPRTAVYDSGDYFDLFRTSDALITCCGSFLAEYLPTGRPIIWLVSEATVGLNRVGERLADSFYVVRNEEELRETFNMVVVEGVDPLRDKRLEAIDMILPSRDGAARQVLREIGSGIGLDQLS